jgi:hypothetical protein
MGREVLKGIEMGGGAGENFLFLGSQPYLDIARQLLGRAQKEC